MEEMCWCSLGGGRGEIEVMHQYAWLTTPANTNGAMLRGQAYPAPARDRGGKGGKGITGKFKPRFQGLYPNLSNAFTR